MNKEQVYEKITMQELGGNPNGTRQEIVWKSMDEYAEQQAIAFSLWKDENYQITNQKGIFSNSIGFYTTEQLYKQFLEQST